MIRGAFLVKKHFQCWYHRDTASGTLPDRPGPEAVTNGKADTKFRKNKEQRTDMDILTELLAFIAQINPFLDLFNALLVVLSFFGIAL